LQEHPDYKQDSVVSHRIAADLMAKCHRIGAGLEHVPELHGEFIIAPVHTKDAYAVDMGSLHRRKTDSSANTQVRQNVRLTPWAL